MGAVAGSGGFIGSFEFGEFGADGVALSGNSDNAANDATCGRSDVRGGFGGFDFHHVLVGFDMVADFHVDADDGGFGD